MVPMSVISLSHTAYGSNSSLTLSLSLSLSLSTRPKLQQNADGQSPEAVEALAGALENLAAFLEYKASQST